MTITTLGTERWRVSNGTDSIIIFAKTEALALEQATKHFKGEQMKIKTEVSESQFIGWFADSSRSTKFTYGQLGILYGVIDSLEDEDGFSPYGDDYIAICCDYSGYDEVELLEEYADEDNIELDDVIAYLESQTEVYYDTDKANFIVRAF